MVFGKSKDKGVFRKEHLAFKSASILQVRVLTAFLFVVFSCCSLPVFAGERLKVVASIFPVAEMARAVGGDRVDVRQLIPPGSDPHSWEPKISDMVWLEKKADLIILIGAGLEPWAEEVVGQVKDVRSKMLELAKVSDDLLKADKDQQKGHGHGHDDHASGHNDPHIWLDFKWDMAATLRIARAMTALDPGGASFYEKNAQNYIEALKKLDISYQKALSSCPRKTFVVAGHAAFGYLARAYGLRQVALYGLSPDASPGPRKMAEVTELVEKEGAAKAVFFDDTVTGSLAKTLSRETGARTFVMTPGESLKRSDISKGTTFIGLMYRNLDALSDGLGCKTPSRGPAE